MTAASGRSPRSRRRAWAVRVLAVCVLLVAGDYLAYPLVARVGSRSFNHGDNGLWLRYKWYFGEWQDADLRALAHRLHAEQIRFAFCHVRHIEPNGRLHYRYRQNARRLVRGLHRTAPGVRVIAWVYVENRPGYPQVNLGDAGVRQSMVREAKWLVADCGFDGVQWDYEICPSGDQPFLALLRETRQALPRGKLISVCTPMWYPWPWPRRYCWAEAYFARVAAHCDQLAVMCYDSAIYLPRGYVWLVRQQVPRVTRATARGNSHCRVLFGVPAYGRGGRSHHHRAENMRMALKGVREGSEDERTMRSALAGVSIFADYTATRQDWDEYERAWLDDHRGRPP